MAIEYAKKSMNIPMKIVIGDGDNDKNIVSIDDIERKINKGVKQLKPHFARALKKYINSSKFKKDVFKRNHRIEFVILMRFWDGCIF